MNVCIYQRHHLLVHCLNTATPGSRYCFLHIKRRSQHLIEGIHENTYKCSISTCEDVIDNATILGLCIKHIKLSGISLPSFYNNAHGAERLNIYHQAVSVLHKNLIIVDRSLND